MKTEPAEWRRSLIDGRLQFLLLFLVLFFAQHSLGLDSDPRQGKYREVTIFDDHVRMIIPRGFHKIKTKKLGQPEPYTAFQRTGYADKNGSILMYWTNEAFPEDKAGTGIWDVMDNLTARFDEKFQLQSGYEVINRHAEEHLKPKDLFFVKVLHADEKGQVTFTLVMCASLEGRMLIGFFHSPKESSIDEFRKDINASLRIMD